MNAPRPFAASPQVAVVLAFVLAAWLSDVTGLDHAIASAAFDPAVADFPARRWPGLELFGHRLAKSAIWVVWFVVLGAAIASHRLAGLAPAQRALWSAVVAMALGPAVVASLKLVTGPRCPWDLIEFGGHAQAATAWFVGAADAGRCFPSGHASGGFALIALYFAGLAIGDARLRRVGLWAGLVAGFVFGGIRIVQGAHFLSHNLWSAAVVWAVATAVFAFALRGRATASAAVPGRVA